MTDIYNFSIKFHRKSEDKNSGISWYYYDIVFNDTEYRLKISEKDGIKYLSYQFSSEVNIRTAKRYLEVGKIICSIFGIDIIAVRKEKII